MKAPEKIYIQSFNINEEDVKFDKSKMFFDDVWTEEPESGQENIEYVRTDAIIGKAERYLKDRLLNYIGYCARGVGVSTEEFIDSFIKYLKKE